ncbi:MAG TPA: hypothetical protein VMD59_11390 [Acidimicrobiales bacterium]|nr:hypothetical protein [Acidimicrobiales bacterium]
MPLADAGPGGAPRPSSLAGRSTDGARAGKGTRRGRPRVVVVARRWGEQHGDAGGATRLVAGALARRAEVVVIELDPDLAGKPVPGAARDSVFTVHRVPVYRSDRRKARLLEVALAAHDGGYRVPQLGAHVQQAMQGVAPDAPRLIESLAPDAVLLAGSEQPYNLDVLGRRGEPGRPRVVVMPMVGDVRFLRSPVVLRLVERADAIATIHPGEQRALAPLGGAGHGLGPEIVPVELGLVVHRASTEHRLFGVRRFGEYVVLLRRFPAGGPRYLRSITHEVLRDVVAPLSVAEVDGVRWRISDAAMTLDLPVAPSRVNLWRLLAHARAVVDVRPPGAVGREAIEAMMLGVPTVVPDGTAAKAHLEAGNGGLWYADHAELVEEVRALADDALHDSLARCGESYGEATHGQIDDFVTRMGELVLGNATGSSAARTEPARGKPAQGTPAAQMQPAGQMNLSSGQD